MNVSQSLKQGIFALFNGIMLCAGLYTFCTPRWETNDDVSMLMVAHGIGVAAVPSPNLIFSNVIWGYIVQSIPTLSGILGYSLATLGVLFISSVVLCYVLRRVGVPWIIVLSLNILLFIRPMLFPQFTVTAGMATLAGVACLISYRSHTNLKLIIAASVLMFVGVVIRSLEFYLIFAVAIPLIPWGQLVRNRSIVLTMSLFLVCVIGAFVIDYVAYMNNKWNEFNNLNFIRAQFTDFGADKIIKQRPDILAKFAYSANDINLIRYWFFADSQLVNPQTLREMLNDIGPLSNKLLDVKSGWLGVLALAHPQIRILLVLALCGMVLLPSRKLLLSWIICIGAVIVMGMIGRPGVMRVYVPVEALLIVAPFLTTHWRSAYPNRVLRTLAGILVLIATCGFTLQLVHASTDSTAQIKQLQSDYKSFPKSVIVAWGDAFSYEALFPVLRQLPHTDQLHLYPLGVFTKAPFSRSYQEAQAGRGLVSRLLSTDGIRVLAKPFQFEFLRLYCLEHFNGELIELSQHNFGKSILKHVRCDTK